MNGYFEVINKSKYLTLVPTNESKVKIKSRELPLDKTIEICTITIVVRAISLENKKFYPQGFLLYVLLF